MPTSVRLTQYFLPYETESYFFALASIACNEDEPAQAFFSIGPETQVIVTETAGARTRTAVGSNCDWQIAETPQWCSAQKVTSGNKEYLELEIDPNEEETSRETVVRLFYEKTSASVRVLQDGKTEQADPLPWTPFPVTTLTLAEYKLSADGTTRNYRITGDRIFVAPSFGRQVYPGHLINRHSDYRTLTAYDQYTCNPIRISALVNGKSYENGSLPAFDAVSKMAQQIIADLPKQSSGYYLSSPIPYYSYWHLSAIWGSIWMNW